MPPNTYRLSIVVRMPENAKRLLRCLVIGE